MRGGDYTLEVKIIQKFENSRKKFEKKFRGLVVARVFTHATTNGRSSSAGGTRAAAIR